MAAETEGQGPPATAAGTQESPSVEESRRGVATEAVPEPRVVSEGKVLSNFFYKNKLAHGHLRALDVMPEASGVPEGLRRELLDGVGPASVSLTVRLLWLLCPYVVAVFCVFLAYPASFWDVYRCSTWSVSWPSKSWTCRSSRGSCGG